MWDRYCKSNPMTILASLIKIEGSWSFILIWDLAATNARTILKLYCNYLYKNSVIFTLQETILLLQNSFKLKYHTWYLDLIMYLVLFYSCCSTFRVHLEPEIANVILILFLVWKLYQSYMTVMTDIIHEILLSWLQF